MHLARQQDPLKNKTRQAYEDVIEWVGPKRMLEYRSKYIKLKVSISACDYINESVLRGKICINKVWMIIFLEQGQYLNEL